MVPFNEKFVFAEIGVDAQDASVFAFLPIVYEADFSTLHTPTSFACEEGRGLSRCE